LSEQRSVYGPKLNQGKSKINTTSTLTCYKLENTEKQGPEKLTINFNNSHIEMREQQMPVTRMTDRAN
jgi:hypothetical protein